MKASHVLLVLLAGLLLLSCSIGSFVTSTYNELKLADQGPKRQWGQVENQLQRRFDVVPALENSVRGAMDQEEDVIGQVTEARKSYGGAQNGSLADKVNSANQYESALSRLLVVIENYPEIRSNERVADLMGTIEGSENRIATERGRYNEEVALYNAKVVKFPKNLVAAAFGFHELPYFKASEGSTEPPVVNLED